MEQPWYVKNQLPVDPQGSAPGSISYMWDHLTYPEMTLSTQQLPLHHYARWQLAPEKNYKTDCNLLLHQLTNQPVVFYLTTPTSSAE